MDHDMLSDYLSMLNSPPEEHRPSPQPFNQGLPEIPFQPARHELPGGIDMHTSPVFSSPYNDFLTSPLPDDPLLEFLSPNCDTPYSEFLPTPDIRGSSSALPPASPSTASDPGTTNNSSGSGQSDANSSSHQHTPLIANDSDPILGLGFRSTMEPTGPLFFLNNDSLGGIGSGPSTLFGGASAEGYIRSMQQAQGKNSPLSVPTTMQPPPPPLGLNTNTTNPTPSPASHPTELDTSTLYTMSPALSDLPDFPPSPGPGPIRRSTRSSMERRPTPISTAERRAPAGGASRAGPDGKYTGTRRNVTPSTLIPDDAPIQRRNYGGSSSASAPRSRRRASNANSTNAHSTFDPSLLTTEAELEEARAAGQLTQVEYKRIQNTLAARKSRKRKLQYQMDLEDRVDVLERERDLWKDRAIMLVGMVRAQGTDFKFDSPE